MIACRIFTGRVKDGQYANRFAPGDRQIVYVIDELALKSQNRSDTITRDGQQIPVVSEIGSAAQGEAFQDSLKTDPITFLERFVKPCYILTGPTHFIDFPKQGPNLEKI